MVTIYDWHVFVWGVLWSCWVQILEFYQSLLDVVGHRQVDMFCFVAPFQVDATK